MSTWPSTTQESTFSHRALKFTKRLIRDLINQRMDGWAELLDTQYVLETPEGAIFHGEDGRLDAALFEAGKLLRSFPADGKLQYPVPPLNEQICSVIVSKTPSNQSSTAPNAASLYYVFVWVARNEKLKLSQCYMCANKTSNASSAAPVAPPAIRLAGKIMSRLQVRTADGEYYWIERDDIVFARARGQYTELHCTKRTLLLHTLIKNALAQIGSPLVRIARSYAVNPRYVDSLRGEMLYLTTGNRIPVPARRIKEVRDLLSAGM